MKRVMVFDTTLRDGEQSPGCGMNAVTKLTIAKQLAALGVDIIEAGFPISSPGDMDAVSQIAREVKGPVICALARTRNEDIGAAAQAIYPAEKKRIHVFVATSDVHMSDKLRKTPDEILRMIIQNVELAKTFTDDVEFSPEDASRTGLEFLMTAVISAVKAGATTINIPDTVGYSQPEEFGKLVSDVVTEVEKINRAVAVSVHCHNDLGLAVSNTLAGVRAGAQQVECTVLGIGERAGNAQLESVVMALKTRKDYYNAETGINTSRLGHTARLVSSMIGKPIDDAKPIVGPNAFKHSSGIHQHGMSKNRTTYEIMNPEEVGWRGETSTLTSRSGRNALRERLVSLGYDIFPALLDKVYKQFLTLADQKNIVYDDDLYLLMQECQLSSMVDIGLIRYERVDYHRVNGALSATITLSHDGVMFEASGAGDGAIASIGDAIIKAITRQGLYPVSSISVTGFNIGKSSGGIESIGVANLKIESEHGHVGYGRGSDIDVLVAFAKAMIAALNHLIKTPVKETVTDNVE